MSLFERELRGERIAEARIARTSRQSAPLAGRG